MAGQSSLSSYPSSYPPARPNLTSIAAACILSGGLITAAIIDSHRPVVSSTTGTGMPLRITPPIAQDSAQQQFEAQIASQSQKFAPYREQGIDYAYKGVKILEVNYSAKDDAFTFLYRPQWQSSTGEDNESLESLSSAGATNDGYGHYTGGANMGGTDKDFCYAHFTIR